MSLHALANHLQSAGRGEDKVLVHMTPGEVKGLQSLAMAHGGSLTINPETGLPEAGILSAILPMVAGFFLGPAGLGLTAMQSAVAVGALGTAATGSLGKGFMMGLGAYGGAGLGEGLSSVGAANIPTGAAGETAANLGGQQTFNAASSTPIELSAPIGNTTTSTAADAAAKTAVEQGGIPAYRAEAYNNIFADARMPPNVAGLPNMPTNATGIATNLGTVSPPSIAGEAMPSLNITGAASPTATSPIVDASQYPANAYNGPVNDIDKIMSQGTPPSAMDKLGAGFNKATGSWEGAKEVWNATPKGTGYGLAATGMGVVQAQQEEAAKDAAAANAAAAAERRGNIRPYDYSTSLAENAFAPSTSTAERRYWTEPRFIAKDVYKVAKEGGIMSLAVGGTVEQMAAQNAVGQNTMYPQSQLQTPMYANPMVQRPIPNDVIGAGIDAPTDRYTGEQRMASGGSTDTKYAYDPKTMQYTQTTTETPAANNRIGMFPGMIGMAPGYMMGLGGNMNLSGNFMGVPYSKLFAQQQAPQPTVTTQTMGGTASPYTPTGLAAAANMPMVPNIQLPQQQNVNQQLGLEAFYPMMEQQLAAKGSQLQARGYAEGGTANGGYGLGSYSDGGRLLRGPGDGVSDSIPASIGNRQPARLADGEFVIPARIVSEIGNGSTEAGARKLYAMMNRVQHARKKTVGKNQVAKNTKAEKLLPA